MADDAYRLAKLGKALKGRRMQAGLSEREMAIALKRSSRYVRACETGKASMTLQELERISEILQVDFADLIAAYKA